MGWFRFILSHSIFIAICATALCWQTYIVLYLPVEKIVLLFVFFSTISSYNFYWLISKYRFSAHHNISTLIRNNLVQCGIAIIACTATAYIILKLPHQIYPVLAFSIVLTFLYSVPMWLKNLPGFVAKAGFLKPVLLALTWAVVTVLLPVNDKKIATSLLAVLFCARFLFVFLLCLIFDLRDMQIDKLKGLSSLATNANLSMVKAVMLMSFILFFVCGFYFRLQEHDLSQTIAFFLTGIMVYVVYRKSFKPQGYYFYYFVVDGLMLFSSLLSYIATLIEV